MKKKKILKLLIGSNNQGNASDSTTIGNRVKIESLADSDGIRAKPRERYQSRAAIINTTRVASKRQGRSV